ncbi:unnamed protein product [Protopolystoma xenopodis]|uniref:Uncharacterized protein n=1 Tax=Protopolystoma xenopodis TaxID=117903 RepID=A0A3S5BJ21_9PLAT|nr:unnamed protein product [Protopolystoma xenopodis]
MAISIFLLPQHTPLGADRLEACLRQCRGPKTAAALLPANVAGHLVVDTMIGAGRCQSPRDTNGRPCEQVPVSVGPELCAVGGQKREQVREEKNEIASEDVLQN